MRLKNIKLAGFKSFVDPTTVHLPSRLTGIVGPNGCGKSNLIDAVRWVMGESSAKQLRGDSLADVIFNGSTVRKPVGQASIELVFDNSAGRLGGEYARFTDIAVKRILSRDGQSVYYLNGTRCRRRDITDIFLGTGLGPRSYAIIEQGMITRIVDAGPDQLRQLLEEAAGISKYKERRRETENRISHTRENLLRINDLRDEIQKQLEKLRRQAKNAERFKVLKARERELKAGLLALRWRAEDTSAQGSEEDCRRVELELEGRLAEQTGVETRLEQAREAQHVANEILGEIQGRFYGAGAEVSRVEQAIRHERDIGHQRKEELSRLQRGHSELTHHIGSDEERMLELEAFLQQRDPELAEVTAGASEARERLQFAEQSLTRWRDARDHLQTRLQEPQRVVHVERTRIDYHERQLIQLQRRRSRLADEQIGTTGSDAEPDIALLLARENELSRQLTELEASSLALDSEEGEYRDLEAAAAEELNASRDALRHHRGRLASLETLQEDALGRTGGERDSWLTEHGLADAHRLGELLEVESGWEIAVEAALGTWLESIGVETLTDFALDLEHLGDGLALYEASECGQADGANKEGLTPILSKIVAHPAATAILSEAYLSPSLGQALENRSLLGAGQYLVTPDGIRVGRSWVCLDRRRDLGESVLARGREIEAIRVQIDSQTGSTAHAELRLAETRAGISSLDSRRRDLHKAANDLHRRHAELQTEINACQSRMEQLERRRFTLEREQSEIEVQATQDQEGLGSARRNMEEALARLEVLERERHQLEAQREEVERQAETCRLEVSAAVEQAGKLRVEVESRRSTLDSLRKSCARQKEQQTGLETQMDTVVRQISSAEQPTEALEAQLEELLEVRARVESELHGARLAVEHSDSRLKQVDRDRLLVEQATQGVREQLQGHRLAASEARVRCQAVAEQMKGIGTDLETALRMMEQDPDAQEWPQELEQVERRIERLGAINLAAIDEYSQESERKQYLDAQHADLTEALDTLEQAMGRIDRETRSRFQSMFDRINEGLGELFPRLFGGGQAYLELTDKDVLEAGVAIMARPPGKRISNIHLLSGGEKALTAISLVFAIFQLNPAPFCMLDEVDAPLDEANVGRYSTLVNEMSEKVQLIVITHNKTTMEIVEHLIGVTMHEPGCSRLVSVDVEEAARLAAV